MSSTRKIFKSYISVTTYLTDYFFLLLWFLAFVKQSKITEGLGFSRPVLPISAFGHDGNVCICAIQYGGLYSGCWALEM